MAVCSSLLSLPGTPKRQTVAFILITCALILSLGHNIHVTRRSALAPFRNTFDPPENANQPIIYPPPKYTRLYDWEKNLPQHSLDLPFPEGRTGRYVKFSNQVAGLGWNNALNELLMNALLAYESERAYVFRDFRWRPNHYPWQPAGPSLPLTPLNALIAGPVSGGLWAPGDPAPRSISENWFDVVCPVDERRILNTTDIKPAVLWEQGDVVFDHWKKILKDAPERCIEIVPPPIEVDVFSQTFDLWLWGTTRVLPLWHKFRTSPISQLLETSPLVNSAVARNEYLFYPRGPRSVKAVTRNPYQRMMAVHIRRGDYKDACLGLANYNSTFYSWNLLPFLPDRFDPPLDDPQKSEMYQEHCFPTFDAILQKIHVSRDEYLEAAPVGTNVDIMYILTDDAGGLVEELKAALGKDGYHTIVTGTDLVLDQEQIGVNMAIDMEVSRRAAVFIGNGWSSFTSNIVHRRLVDGRLPISNRFW